MVTNQEWRKLNDKITLIKSKYKSNPQQWIGLKTWHKAFKSKIQSAMDTDFKNFRHSDRDWRKFHNFANKWRQVSPENVTQATKLIHQRWYKFKTHDTVYYNNKKYTISSINISPNKNNGAPQVILKNNNQQRLELDMFDKTIITEKQYIQKREEERKRLAKLAQEQAELRRKIAAKEKQERERKQREKAEAERKRKEEIQRQKQAEIARKKAEKEKKIAALRKKLEDEQRKKKEKKAMEELKLKQKEALKRCYKILEKARLKRFINAWRERAAELAAVRQHYRITQDDDILRNKPSSMETTLDLLQAHSPAKTIKHNPRKRRTPDSASSYNYSHLQRPKRQKFGQFHLSWSPAQIIDNLAEKNKEAINIMTENSNNTDHLLPTDLVFNILVSTVPNNDNFNENVLKHFGVERPEEELQKRIFADKDRRMHYCVITDDKIKSIGATKANCVRGFQGYIHCCQPTAILDFDHELKKWSLNEKNKNNLIQKLGKTQEKMRDSLRLLHDHSKAAILILIECQPLYTNLRDDQVAINTLIEFDDKDCKLIKSALNIKKKNLTGWNIKVLGVPSWPNSYYYDTFKYGMEWMILNSPNYPKLYKVRTDVINNIFEKIFDSKLLKEEQKTTLWNGEIDNVIKNVIGGINGNISWPPCSIDDHHELVKKEVLPPSNWNDDNVRKEILQSLTDLKIKDDEDMKQNDDPKRYILRGIRELKKDKTYWWTMANVVTSRDLFETDCSISGSTFATFADSSFNNSINNDSISSKSNNDLMEFDKLVEGVSQDFETTLKGLESCGTVVESMNVRLTNL